MLQKALTIHHYRFSIMRFRIGGGGVQGHRGYLPAWLAFASATQSRALLQA
jgi:hypothetical protein